MAKLKVGENDFQTLHPDLLHLWDYEKNVGINPSDFTCGSNKVVNWICENGHEWPAPIYRIARGSGCPHCAKQKSTSFPEQAILFYLSKAFETKSREKVFNQEVDILLPKLNSGIEYDGLRYHSNEFSLKREKIKDEILQKNGFNIIRVKETKDIASTFIENNVIFYKYDAPFYRHLNDVIKLLFKYFGQKINFEINIDNDSPKIREQYMLLRKQNSFVKVRPELLDEWDYEKNGKLRPEYVSYQSSIVAHWICKNGHNYPAVVSNRVKGTGCPYCSNNKLLENYNDLKTKHPEVLVDWDYKKNKKGPEKYIFSSEKRVHWKCHVCGKEWIMPVFKASKGQRCPICTRKETIVSVRKKRLLQRKSFAERHPDLMLDWDAEKNEGINPFELLDGSHQEVHWKCHICGFTWDTTLHTRSVGTGCPSCASRKANNDNIKSIIKRNGSFVDNYPYLLKEWDFDKNHDVDPNKLTNGSSYNAHWVCSKCGHEWCTPISNRTRGYGCPACAKEKRKQKVKNITTNTIYNSLFEAAKLTGYRSASISKACKNGTEYKGCFWQFV